MKYSIIECVNGNFFIRAEGITVLKNAITQWHNRCETLWSASDVITAHVMIANEQLEVVEGYKEFIHHETE